ncbi:MAG: hypothetical protein IPO67_26610 [Deltaproteobacteria bacterium]|nr:hypothetical protein [Deltaproteobacteria bacterium]
MSCRLCAASVAPEIGSALSCSAASLNKASRWAAQAAPSCMPLGRPSWSASTNAAAIRATWVAATAGAWAVATIGRPSKALRAAGLRSLRLTISARAFGAARRSSARP